MPKENSVGAVLFKKQGEETKFLLLHYNAGHWGFPKGHVEEGETDEETLYREVKEETGLTEIELLPAFKEPTKYLFRRGQETVFKEVFFYLAEVKQGRVKISHEHQGFEWLPFEKALERLSFKNTRQVLTKAVSFV